jgi:hypothetical protein
MAACLLQYDYEPRLIHTLNLTNFYLSKTRVMSKKDNTGSKGTDGTTTKNKGESQQSRQKGAQSVSSKNKGKHKKDESDGSDTNTTKKQQNSI